LNKNFIRIDSLTQYADDEGGEMDEDDEDEQMFLGFSSHQRHLPFGWEGDIDSPVIVSRGHNRCVIFRSSPISSLCLLPYSTCTSREFLELSQYLCDIVVTDRYIYI